MNKVAKVRCERREGGQVFIQCPFCHRSQELPQGNGGYEIDTRGKVHPVFVCMSKVSDLYCTYEGYIWIINW